jgi:FdrA protein
MSATVVNLVRPGFYLDSVALMRLSSALSEREGVGEVVLMIGTETNKGIMHAAGVLDDTGRTAGPGDLVIAVRASSTDAAQTAIAEAQAQLDKPRNSSNGNAAAPRTQDAALQQLPDANLALISVPGEFAVREAHRALSLGLNVLLFSDNISLDDELELKTRAADLGLLVMGPDCGTAYISGTPLAFANRVRAGNVGIVAASGTGLQELAVLLHHAGHGISHGIGVGGRDLSDAVGAKTTLQALTALDADPQTAHIILVSKPPGERTVDVVFEALGKLTTPASACLLGLDAATAATSPVPMSATLADAVRQVTGRADSTTNDETASRAAARLSRGRTRLEGLFCGGTLATEAKLVFQSNGLAAERDFRVIDLGDDDYTQGRPHPMIEPQARTGHIHTALAAPDTAVVLIDVMLGLGAHADPAGVVAQALDARSADGPVIIAHVCGTNDDPQVLDRQQATLRECGVLLCDSSTEAAALAAKVARLAAANN